MISIFGKKAFTWTVVVATIAWAMSAAFIAIPLTASVATVAGDLIVGTARSTSGAGRPVYYYGADGKRWLFPSSQTYKAWYGMDFSMVKDVTEAELQAIPFGGNITAKAGSLVKFNGPDSNYYVVEKGGVRRQISVADAATVYGAGYATSAYTIPESFQANYTAGAAATASFVPATAASAGSTIAADKGMVSSLPPSLSPQSQIVLPTVDVKINLSDGPLRLGNNVYVTAGWTSSNAIRCRIYTPSGDKDAALSGTEQVFVNGGVNTAFFYTVECTNLHGRSSDRVDMSIIVKSPITYGCALNNPVCKEGEICLRNTCVRKNEFLPSNAVTSQTNCAYDEVYRNGHCERSKVNVIFVQNGITDAQTFDDWIDISFANFIYASPLKNCPDRVRIHKDFNFCAPLTKGFTQHIIDTIGSNFASMMMLSPFGYTEEKNCSAHNTLPVGGFLPLMNDNKVALTHELGHSFGLWDQYCYYPSPANPNPTDFIAGGCKPAESDWYRSYCSRDKIGATYTPYQCVGDPNPFGGTTVMGAEGHGNPEDPGFGYSQREFDYLSTKINCD